MLVEQHRGVELALYERAKERRVAVAGQLVDVRAALDEGLGGANVALAYRVMERREAALGRDRGRRAVLVERGLRIRRSLRRGGGGRAICRRRRRRGWFGIRRATAGRCGSATTAN